MSEPEVATLSAKGQVVIPQALREKLKLKPKTKLLVYGEDDMMIMKKLNLPDLKEEWERIRQIMEERNRKHGALTEEDIRREVEDHRREKAK
jgi:AbrB family looped-hinge helix DNA binding protein